MSKQYFGEPTKGKDGNQYRSKFEANFCNKFLYENWSYEYEKPYSFKDKRKCDFYVAKLDLWIECSAIPFYRQYTYNNAIGNVYINCPYSDKDIVKSYGCKWDAENKLWYIPNHLAKAHVFFNLHKYMTAEDCSFELVSDEEFTEGYHENLKKKISDNPEKRIILVFEDDVENCKNILDLLRVKDNDYFLELCKEFPELAKQCSFEPKGNVSLSLPTDRVTNVLNAIKKFSDIEYNRFQNEIKSVHDLRIKSSTRKSKLTTGKRKKVKR